MRSILLVGISVRAFAQSGVNAGYSVKALDAFGDLDLRACAETYSLRKDFQVPYDARALYEAARDIGCEAVAYTSNLENHPAVIRSFAASRQVIGNPPDAVRRVRQWEELFVRLKKAGFAVPETLLAGGEADFSRGRWLIKPVLSGGGHGVRFWQGKPPEGGRYMLQRYIEGRSCSALFAANGRECDLIGITEQMIGREEFGARGFRYCGSILPLDVMLDPARGRSIMDQVRRAAEFLSAEFGLSGVNGFDFILDDDDKVHLLEINPRYTASMELVERAYGLSIFHMHVQAVLERRLPGVILESLLNSGEFFGKSILFCHRATFVPETTDWQMLDAGDVPAPGERLAAGSPVCTLRAAGKTRQDVMAELIGKARSLEAVLYG